MLRGALVALLFIMAGCVEEEPPVALTNDAAPEPEPAPTGDGADLFTPTAATNETPEVRSFADSFDLTVTQVRTVGTNSFGSNCINVRGAPFQLANLTLVATWTSTTPLDADLELVVDEFFGAYREQVTGPSPLALDLLSPLPPADASTSQRPEEFYAIAVQAPNPGLAIELPVTLDVAFDYVADGGLEVNVGGCALG